MLIIGNDFVQFADDQLIIHLPFAIQGIEPQQGYYLFTNCL